MLVWGPVRAGPCVDRRDACGGCAGSHGPVADSGRDTRRRGGPAGAGGLCRADGTCSQAPRASRYPSTT